MQFSLFSSHCLLDSITSLVALISNTNSPSVPQSARDHVQYNNLTKLKAKLLFYTLIFAFLSGKQQ